MFCGFFLGLKISYQTNFGNLIIQNILVIGMYMQGCIFFCLALAKIWLNNVGWGKKWLKVDDKRGENAYFPPNWLKIYKTAKKRLKIFRMRRVPPHYNKFNLGKNMNQEGGGGIQWISNLLYTPDMLWKGHCYCKLRSEYWPLGSKLESN